MNEQEKQPHNGDDDLVEETRMLSLGEDEVEEETVEAGKKVRRRGIYLLPNLFTTGALFSGFFAIVSAMNGAFDSAAIAIFISMILDGLDGRVARLTNTQSDFGAEYDSLADMVSFGVAPALVAFSWMLSDIGKIGWIAAFVYVAGAALRLARFNTQIGSVDKRWFIGLPSPAAAAVVAGIVWTFSDLDLNDTAYTYALAFIVASIGVLMVSNVRYNSFKEIDLKGRVPFLTMFVIAIFFVVIAYDPATVLLLLFMGYAGSGPGRALLRRVKKADQ
ncbi:CDP-diacylglycerol--serine O-phosphatidyltransferase [Oceanospirillum sediminis]|uniref:CDP-diacylglycerol--serine O-phosphatidyltransferase n=1 Tax=Oceanospirillum sediminis TaxID=2760088 RepID=A0A839IQT6_9GAMM|nr:CDP-diacylglycerol--serine O-phosphatidyltransferase [Oceanospirillum sediminis]MBB1486586.1 CDP-diacylglycerol--serine O-phosphatidyltransferase [Oceanospirillum sediminis]